MSISIVKNSACTGCLACMNCCPIQCISEEIDSCGFSYPKVNEEKCIECGQCEKICPLISNKNVSNGIQGIYAAWTNDHELRFMSTSGGIFSEIARKFVKTGGAVCAAAYDKNNDVKHVITHFETNISELAQSKYVQSQLGETLIEIRRLLAKGEKVLFVGTPCQVAAINNFCSEYSDRLYTIDFICRGVNSPKAYRAWISELERKHRALVKKIWFKYKDKGWKRSPRNTLIEFNTGKKIILRDYYNSYMVGYLGPNLYIRPSCSDCMFKGENRVSDITLGDFWGVEPELDSDEGTSMLLISTRKGRELFEAVSDNITAYEKKMDNVVKGNKCFNGSVTINRSSKCFLEAIDSEHSFSKLVNAYAYESKFSRYKYAMKSLIKNVMGV